ncbi:MAG: sensor histidine kinase, partial [Alistipes sp.]|nr:sensor histidine kinase [Alistipes sp.]
FGGIQLLNFRYWQASEVLQHKASFSDLEWYWNVVLGMFMIGTNTMIKLYYRALDTERKMVQMQRHALQAQMDYLKYQINPHFFMNTLNNIHSLIDIDAKMAKQSVIELSKMMRYVLYDSEGAGTTLEKEVQFVGNYMELMRIRYVDDVEISFEHPSSAVCRRIVVPPLLLIVFVENAFKHGVSYNHRSFIRIGIEVTGGMLHYRVVNSRHGKAADCGGVGLDNVRKRLALLFGKGFSLDIDTSSESTYEVNLIIPVKNHG